MSVKKSIQPNNKQNIPSRPSNILSHLKFFSVFVMANSITLKMEPDSPILYFAEEECSILSLVMFWFKGVLGKYETASIVQNFISKKTGVFHVLL